MSKLPRWYLRHVSASHPLSQAMLDRIDCAIYDDLMCVIEEWDWGGVVLRPLNGEGYDFWVDYEDPDLVLDPEAKDVLARCSQELKG